MALEFVENPGAHGDNFSVDFYTKGTNDADVEVDVDWLEDLMSPDSERFFHLMGTLMASASERVLHPEEMDKMDLLGQGQNSPEESAEADGENRKSVQAAADLAGTCRSYLVESESVVDCIAERVAAEEAQDQLMESLRKRKFFGIYRRVRLKAAWRKLVRPGTVLRTKKLRIMAINPDAIFPQYKQK